MFTKNLSTSIRSICDSRKLSYETVAELCDLSPRYFGAIARGQTDPSIITLEKLCVAFDRSPNELLYATTSREELAFRVAAQVVHYRIYPFLNGKSTTFPVCPSCSTNVEREYQRFCTGCGQKLFWDFYCCATPLTKR